MKTAVSGRAYNPTPAPQIIAREVVRLPPMLKVRKRFTSSI